MPPKILRLKQSLELDGDCKTGRYNKIKRGLYTTPFLISSRCVGWPEHECTAIISARIAGWSDDQIRELVKQLHEKRKQYAPIIAGNSEPALAGA
ncbi:MAG: transcriptional regulator [Burkholderiales bacterium PBB1]|nr:MAG: transcriptional regulator [Burkholderiales bacterium PBB1]